MAMSNRWMTDYPEDVLAWMRERETKHLPYNGSSPQISSRRELVDLICTVAEKLKLSVITTHLAVYLLDRVMDNHFIIGDQLKPTALVALLVAAKFEEKDANIPVISTLIDILHNSHPLSFFISLERFILEFFDWNVGTVTVAHFVELYLMSGVSIGEMMNGSPVTSPNMARQALWSFTAYFVDLSLRDLVFLQWPVSMVAAASLACGRYYCSFQPVWSVTLEKTTGYSVLSLLQIMDHFWSMVKHERRSIMCNTPDSGYTGSCYSLERSP